MSRKARAAAVQLSPVLFSREGTTEKVCAKIAEAAARGAELVVFPETVVPYYPYFSFIKAPAVIGAEVTSDWVPYRLAGDALYRLAKRAATVTR